MVPWSWIEHTLKILYTHAAPHTQFYCFKDSTYQAFDNLQQFLHHHSDALVAQKSAHDLDVWRTHKVPVGTKYAAVCQVQRLCSEERQMMMVPNGET